MNDIRRTILWVIFGFSLVLLWDQWQIYNGHKATFFPAPVKQAPAASAPASAAAAAASTAANSGVPATTAAATPGGVPTSAAAATGAAPTAEAAPAVPRQSVQISTDVLRLTFDSEGASLVQSEFLKHADADDKKKPLVLLERSASRNYVAQSGLIGTAAGAGLPNHATGMLVLPGERVLKDGSDELAIKFESPEMGGVKLVKTYTLKRGSYVINVRHEVVNHGAAPVAPELYLQLVRDGNKLPGESSFYSTFTGPAVYTSAHKYQKVEFKDIQKGKVDIAPESSDGYIAMVQHYFASAWILPDGVKRKLQMQGFNPGLPVPDCCYRVAMVAPLEPIAAGASKSVDAQLFVGPQEEKVLEKITPGLELVKDYGWTKILAEPLYWLLDKLHGIIGNWGWAIIMLVVLLKAAFYWLNAKAYASMARTKLVNPKIMEMRERLKDKPQQMQQEMMRIYREEKINPLGGCLPIFVQIPVFISLYWVLLSSVEMRNAPWALWIHDLSAADPYFILPLVMTGTTVLQTWLNPTPPDPMQAKMMWIMPLAFSVMFFFFPAGLVLYWITNNALSILQQWFINKRLGALGMK